jgi:ABC-type transporter Mla subunit MlaD
MMTTTDQLLSAINALSGKMDALSQAISLFQTSTNRQLLLMSQRMDILMALVDDLKAAISLLDTETTKIAAVVDGLNQRLQQGNLSAAEQQEVFGALSAVSARLQALGQDPSNPVPPAPPQLAAAGRLAGVPGQPQASKPPSP